MFNMTKIRSSNAAGKSFYANHLASNDYYSEHEKVVGFWRGSLAEKFGLAGQEVTTSVFSLFQIQKIEAAEDFLSIRFLCEYGEVTLSSQKSLRELFDLMRVERVASIDGRALNCRIQE